MGKRKHEKYNGSVYKSLALISQFGINMLVPIFLCSFLGYFIDKQAGTQIWFIVLFFLGAAAGFRNIYIMARGLYQNDKEVDGEDKKHK